MMGSSQSVTLASSDDKEVQIPADFFSAHSPVWRERLEEGGGLAAFSTAPRRVDETCSIAAIEAFVKLLRAPHEPRLEPQPDILEMYTLALPLIHKYGRCLQAACKLICQEKFYLPHSMICGEGTPPSEGTSDRASDRASDPGARRLHAHRPGAVWPGRTDLQDPRAALRSLHTGVASAYANNSGGGARYINSAGGLRTISLVIEKPVTVHTNRQAYPRPGVRTATNLEVDVWRLRDSTVALWEDKLMPPHRLPSSPRESDHHGCVL